jgi:hypothetical protein
MTFLCLRAIKTFVRMCRCLGKGSSSYSLAGIGRHGIGESLYGLRWVKLALVKVRALH